MISRYKDSNRERTIHRSYVKAKPNFTSQNDKKFTKKVSSQSYKDFSRNDSSKRKPFTLSLNKYPRGARDSRSVSLSKANINTNRTPKPRRKSKEFECVSKFMPISNETLKPLLVPGSIGEMLLKHRIREMRKDNDSKEMEPVKVDELISIEARQGKNVELHLTEDQNDDEDEITLRYRALQSAMKGCKSSPSIEAHLLKLLNSANNETKFSLKSLNLLGSHSGVEIPPQNEKNTDEVNKELSQNTMGLNEFLAKHASEIESVDMDISNDSFNDGINSTEDHYVNIVDENNRQTMGVRDENINNSNLQDSHHPFPIEWAYMIPPPPQPDQPDNSINSINSWSYNQNMYIQSMQDTLKKSDTQEPWYPAKPAQLPSDPSTYSTYFPPYQFPLVSSKNSEFKGQEVPLKSEEKYVCNDQSMTVTQNSELRDTHAEHYKSFMSTVINKNRQTINKKKDKHRDLVNINLEPTDNSQKRSNKSPVSLQNIPIKRRIRKRKKSLKKNINNDRIVSYEESVPTSDVAFSGSSTKENIIDEEDEDMLRAQLLNDMTLKNKAAEMKGEKSLKEQNPKIIPAVCKTKIFNNTVPPFKGQKKKWMKDKKLSKINVLRKPIKSAMRLDIGGQYLDTKNKFLDAPPGASGFSLRNFPPVKPVIISLSKDSDDSEEESEAKHGQTRQKEDGFISEINNFIRSFRNSQNKPKVANQATPKTPNIKTPKGLDHLSKERQEEYRQLRALFIAKKRTLQQRKTNRNPINKSTSSHSVRKEANLPVEIVPETDVPKMNTLPTQRTPCTTKGFQITKDLPNKNVSYISDESQGEERCSIGEYLKSVSSNEESKRYDHPVLSSIVGQSFSNLSSRNSPSSAYSDDKNISDTTMFKSSDNESVESKTTEVNYKECNETVPLLIPDKCKDENNRDAILKHSDIFENNGVTNLHRHNVEKGSVPIQLETQLQGKIDITLQEVEPLEKDMIKKEKQIVEIDENIQRTNVENTDGKIDKNNRTNIENTEGMFDQNNGKTNVENTQEKVDENNGEIKVENAEGKFDENNERTDVEGNERKFDENNGITDVEGNEGQFDENKERTDVERNEENFDDNNGRTDIENREEKIDDNNGRINVENTVGTIVENGRTNVENTEGKSLCMDLQKIEDHEVYIDEQLQAIKNECTCPLDAFVQHVEQLDNDCNKVIEFQSTDGNESIECADIRDAEQEASKEHLLSSNANKVEIIEDRQVYTIEIDEGELNLNLSSELPTGETEHTLSNAVKADVSNTEHNQRSDISVASSDDASSSSSDSESSSSESSSSDESEPETELNQMEINFRNRLLQKRALLQDSGKASCVDSETHLEERKVNDLDSNRSSNGALQSLPDCTNRISVNQRTNVAQNMSVINEKVGSKNVEYLKYKSSLGSTSRFKANSLVIEKKPIEIKSFLNRVQNSLDSKSMCTPRNSDIPGSVRLAQSKLKEEALKNKEELLRKIRQQKREEFKKTYLAKQMVKERISTLLKEATDNEKLCQTLFTKVVKLFSEMETLIRERKEKTSVMTINVAKASRLLQKLGDDMSLSKQLECQMTSSEKAFPMFAEIQTSNSKDGEQCSGFLSQTNLLKRSLRFSASQDAILFKALGNSFSLPTPHKKTKSEFLPNENVKKNFKVDNRVFKEGGEMRSQHFSGPISTPPKKSFMKNTLPAFRSSPSRRIIKPQEKQMLPQQDQSASVEDLGILCPYDLLGRCNDDHCAFNHTSSVMQVRAKSKKSVSETNDGPLCPTGAFTKETDKTCDGTSSKASELDLSESEISINDSHNLNSSCLLTSSHLSLPESVSEANDGNESVYKSNDKDDSITLKDSFEEDRAINKEPLVVKRNFHLKRKASRGSFKSKKRRLSKNNDTQLPEKVQNKLDVSSTDGICPSGGLISKVPKDGSSEKSVDMRSSPCSIGSTSPKIGSSKPIEAKKKRLTNVAPNTPLRCSSRIKEKLKQK